MECVKIGPLVMSGNVDVLSNLITKTVIKSFMRAKGIRVVDEEGKDYNKSQFL